MTDLKPLFDALPVGVIALDPRGLVEFANPAAVERLDVVVGRPVPTQVRDALASRESAIIDGGDGHTLVRRLDHDGRTLLVGWDVSEQVALEVTRDRILSTISHELRTPLTSLRGFAELLLARDFDADRQREFLTIIRDEAVRLGHLVRDFLDLQRLRAGRRVYDFSWHTPESLIAQAVSEAAANWPGVTITITSQGDVPRVSGDQDALVRAIGHLLDNACRVSEPDGTVRVVIDGDGPVRIRVVDDGPGIEPERLAALFEVFQRGERTGGSGLGLALVREIMRAHEGHVHAESAPGAGATFELHFVRVAAGSDDRLAGLDAPSDKDVLVVGFDEARARLLVEACVARGWTAVACRDVDDATERLTRAGAAGALVRGAPDDATLAALGAELPSIWLSDSGTAPGLAAQGVPFSSRPLLMRAPARLVSRHVASVDGARLVLLDDDATGVANVATALTAAGARVLTPESSEWPDAIAEGADLVIVHLRMRDDLGFRTIRAMRRRPDAWRVPVLAVADRAPTPSEQGFLDRRTIDLAPPADPGEAVRALAALRDPGAPGDA